LGLVVLNLSLETAVLVYEAGLGIGWTNGKCFSVYLLTIDRSEFNHRRNHHIPPLLGI
jgi:hypothetical protein